MIRLAFICPGNKGDLEKYAVLGDIHLLLEHLVEEGNEYTAFYKDRVAKKELVILDNGLFEFHVAAPTERILEKAKIVGAKVLVAPDVLYDAAGTLASTKAFTEEVTKADPELMTMAVPQANTAEEWIQNYQDLCKVPGVRFIGMSCLSIPHCFKEITKSDDVGVNRVACMQELIKRKVVDPNKWHHLLGLGTDVNELAIQSYIGIAASNDSSSAILHGMRGITYKDGKVPGGKLKDKMDFTAKINTESEPAILLNMLTLHKFSKGI